MMTLPVSVGSPKSKLRAAVNSRSALLVYGVTSVRRLLAAIQTVTARELLYLDARDGLTSDSKAILANSEGKAMVVLLPSDLSGETAEALTRALDQTPRPKLVAITSGGVPTERMRSLFPLLVAEGAALTKDRT